jgi:hypothetical protein
MDYYACTFIIHKIDEKNNEVWSRSFTSSIPNQEDYSDVEYDIVPYFVEMDEYKNLENGTYYVFIYGKTEWESNINWEYGNDDGEYGFDFDNVKISQLPENYQ